METYSASLKYFSLEHRKGIQECYVTITIRLLTRSHTGSSDVVIPEISFVYFVWESDIIQWFLNETCFSFCKCSQVYSSDPLERYPSNHCLQRWTFFSFCDITRWVREMNFVTYTCLNLQFFPENVDFPLLPEFIRKMNMEFINKPVILYTLSRGLNMYWSSFLFTRAQKHYAVSLFRGMPDEKRIASYLPMRSKGLHS